MPPKGNKTKSLAKKLGKAKKSKGKKVKRKDSITESSTESEETLDSDSSVDDYSSSAEETVSDESCVSVNKKSIKGVGKKDKDDDDNDDDETSISSGDDESADDSDTSDDDDDDEDGHEEDGKAESNSPQDSEKVAVTAKGKKRLRNYRWTKEERHALFMTCLKNERVLKSRGPDPHKEREAAWEKVLVAVNSVDDHMRTMRHMRKQINDFFFRTKKKNRKFLKRLRHKKKVKGCTPAEILCLKWKDVRIIVGPKGKMVYHTPKFGKRSNKVVSKKVKTDTKSPKKVEPKDKEAGVAALLKTPKKTVRNRLPLPELEDDTTTYINGQIFQSLRQPKPPTKAPSESGDDDLKATFQSYSVSDSSSMKQNRSDMFVDLTASTPKDIIHLDDSSYKKPVRRSPRNQNKGEIKKAVKNKDCDLDKAKKALNYDATTVDSSKMLHVPLHAKTYQEEHGDTEDPNMRIVRLESLVTTMEIERRDEYKNRREQEYSRLQQRERMLTLLERHVADRRLLVETLANSNDNQKKLIQALGSLTYLVDNARKTSNKKCQTDPCPQLDAQHLTVQTEGQDVTLGKVINVQASKCETTPEKSVCINASGNIEVLTRRQEVKISDQASAGDAGHTPTNVQPAHLDLGVAANVGNVIDNSAVDLSLPVLSLQVTPKNPNEAPVLESVPLINPEEQEFHVRFHDGGWTASGSKPLLDQPEEEEEIPDIIPPTPELVEDPADPKSACPFTQENAVRFLSSLEEHVQNLEEKDTRPGTSVKLPDKNNSDEDSGPKPPKKKTRTQEVSTPLQDNDDGEKQAETPKGKVEKKGKTAKNTKRKTKRR